MFLELKLPPNGDLNASKNKKTLGYTRRAGARIKLSKQFSTTKVPSTVSALFFHLSLWYVLPKYTLFLFHQDVLEKLKPLHQLPSVILEWRRITNALTKVVFPLQREKKWHSLLKMDRIHPVSQSHTATGVEHEEIPFKLYVWQKCNVWTFLSHRARELYWTKHSKCPKRFWNSDANTDRRKSTITEWCKQDVVQSYIIVVFFPFFILYTKIHGKWTKLCLFQG